MQEVHRIQADGVFGLAYLPVFVPAGAFQFFAEAADLVDERLVGGWCREKPSNPAHHERRGILAHQPGPEQELSKLLKRRFQFTHGSIPFHNGANGVPSRDDRPPHLAAPAGRFR